MYNYFDSFPVVAFIQQIRMKIKNERDVLKMGLFDFLKKKSKTSNTTTLQYVAPQKETVNKLGVVSTNKVLLDSSVHTLLQSKFIAFDVETTGLSPQSDKIIEIGAVLFENGEIIRKYSSLVNPEVHIPYKMLLE